MNELKSMLLFFFILFLVIFIVYYFIVFRPKLSRKNRKKKKDITNIELEYISGKFKIKKEDLLNKKAFMTISYLNAFIISLVSTIVTYINTNIVIKLTIGFILLTIFIYLVYELYGRYLKGRGNKNE